MSAGRSIIFIISAGAALLFAGCATIRQEMGAPRHHAEIKPGLSPDKENLAEALANYSMGVLNELTHDAGALTNYTRVIELDPSSIQAYIGIAAHHIRNEDPGAAIEIMQECCERNPGSMKAHIYLAQLAQTLDRPELALDASRKAVEIAPHDHIPYTRLASVHAVQGSHAEAISVLKDALGKVEDTLPILRYLGDLHAQNIHSSPPEKAMRHLKEAIRYYNNASQMPYDALTPAYLHRLSDLHIMNQDIEQAITSLERLALYLPHDIQVHKKLALCYMAVDDKPNAVLALRKVIEDEPDNAEVYFYMGELYEAMNDTENAIKYYSKASDASDASPLPHLKLAALYLTASEFDKASRTLEKGLKRLPDNIELLSMSARVNLMEKRYAEAASVFERLLDNIEARDLPILDSASFLDFGLAAQRADRMDKASLFYEKGLEANPASIELAVRLAILRMDQDDMDKAIEIMENMASRFSDDPDAHYYLGLFYFQAERFEDAVKSYKAIEEIARASSDVTLNSDFFFNYGAALERMEDYESAEIMLSQAISLNPEAAEALNYLAYMWAEMGTNLNIAREYVIHALDLDPHNGAFIDTLGWIFYKQGKYELALDHIENALFFMPDDPIIAKHMGDILHALDRDEEAVEWWIYSFGLDPSNEKSGKRLRDHGVDTDKLLEELAPESP